MPESPAGDAGAWAAATDQIGEHGAPDVVRGHVEPPAEPAGDPAHAASPPPESPASPPAASPASRPGSAAGRPPASAARYPAPGGPARPPARPGRPPARRPESSGGDLLSDMQRWLLRSGAKSMRRQLEGQVRAAIGGKRPEPGDIWGTATTEVPPETGLAPECLWCPICRAARRMRESGPGLGSQLSGASDVVASAVQDALAVFDSALSRPAPGAPPPGPVPEAGPRDAHVHPAGDQGERLADEPGDRG